jgi:hypothetical protein
MSSIEMPKFSIKNIFKGKKDDPRSSVGPLRAVKEDLYGKKPKKVPKVLKAMSREGAAKIPKPKAMQKGKNPLIQGGSKDTRYHPSKELTEEYIKMVKNDKKNEEFFGFMGGKKLPESGNTMMGPVSTHRYKKGTMTA